MSERDDERDQENCERGSVRVRESVRGRRSVLELLFSVELVRFTYRYAQELGAIVFAVVGRVHVYID